MQPSYDDNRSAETDYESVSDQSERDEEEPLHSTQNIRVDKHLKHVKMLLEKGGMSWETISESDKRQLLLRTRHSSGPTALHILADKTGFGTDESSDLKKLVEFLVKSDLVDSNGNETGRKLVMETDDNSGYTPLHLAIYRKNRAMIRLICAACENVDAVLKICGTKLKRNCIHLAIDSAKGGKDKTARSLVDLASAETLAQKDEEGNTPLHLAVEYNRCKEGQIRLVEAIVERSDDFIREKSDGDFNTEQKSPYLHHLATAPAAFQATVETLSTAVVPLRPASLRKENGVPGVPMPASAGMTGDKSGSTESTARSESGPTQRNAAQDLDEVPPESSNDLLDPSTQIEESLSQRTRAGSTVTRIEESNKTPDAVSTTPSIAASNTAPTDEIRDFLKKHYLRSRAQDAALEILYGRNPVSEKAISFDLSGYKSLTNEEIEKHISILDFESVLQYVDIPKIAMIEQTPKPRSRATRAHLVAQQDGEARTDAQAVFEMLREKQVETILDLTVDDLENPSHSDWAIERALCGDDASKDMKIETWNWKKVDISPELLGKVASGATSVHLYWSGNNAVLRAWSEEDGLPKLTKLVHVALHVQRGYLDPRQRIEDNIKAFRERLIKQFALARASAVLEGLRDEIDKHFGGQSCSEETRDEVHERLFETGKAFSDSLHAELAKAIETKEPKLSKDDQTKKQVLNKAKESIRAFGWAERRREWSDAYAILNEAKQVARTRAKTIAEDVAPSFCDLDIEVYYPGGSRRTYNDGSQSPDGHLEGPQKHEWIQCMTEFRQLLYNAEKGFCKNRSNVELLKRTVEATGGPITVALIDDGIEVTEVDLDKSVVLTGRSFFPKPPEEKGKPFPWYLSSSGHGTVMASQIHRIAPKANLCLLKLQDSIHPRSHKRTITIRSAAQAILEATRRKVHVISMSWTITPPSHGSLEEQKDVRDLESAIIEADRANILMFCSASDEGARQADTLPSKALPGKIIKIGGANANGTLYDRVGDIAAVDFILPGQLVASEQLMDTAVRKVQYWSGSSVATALAAGLAALILYCAQIRVARAAGDADREIAMNHLQALRHPDKMKDAFNSMCSRGPTKKYPSVWDVFGEKVRQSAVVKIPPSPNDLIDLVADVTRAF